MAKAPNRRQSREGESLCPGHDEYSTACDSMQTSLKGTKNESQTGDIAGREDELVYTFGVLYPFGVFYLLT